MSSWAREKVAEFAGWVVPRRLGRSGLLSAAIRETIEEAARRCDEALVQDERDNGAAATGSAAEAKRRVLAMLTYEPAGEKEGT